MVGTSKGYVWDLENNNCKNPGARLLLKIAQALGTTVEVLLTGENMPNFPNLTAEYEYEESIVYEGLKTIDAINPGKIAVVSIAHRQFNLKFGVLSSADFDTLWAFYIQQSGQFKPFIFTSPRDNQQYTVHFVNKAISRPLFVYLLESVGLNLIEVIEETNL